MSWFSSLMELRGREKGRKEVGEKKRDDKLKKKKLVQLLKKKNRSQDQRTIHFKKLLNKIGKG